MTTVGSGKHTYTLTADWAKMPDAHPLGAVSAIASDSAPIRLSLSSTAPPATSKADGATAASCTPTVSS